MRASHLKSVLFLHDVTFLQNCAPISHNVLIIVYPLSSQLALKIADVIFSFEADSKASLQAGFTNGSNAGSIGGLIDGYIAG